MNKFTDYKLQDFIINNLKAEHIESPTEVQEKSLPFTLSGKDVIGKAKTGTGKTFSYLIPMVEKIDENNRNVQMIVLSPSRELAMQILKEAKKLTKDTNIRCQSFVEGHDMNKQIKKVKEKPQLIVATPGRLIHLLGDKNIKVHDTKIIALDEVDQILQKGSKEKVYKIIKSTLKDRQILSFSATLSEEAKTVLEDIMENPIRLYLDHAKPVPQNIEHKYIVSKAPTKTHTLDDLLKIIKPKKSLVFINKNENVERFVKSIRKRGYLVEGIQTRTKNQQRETYISQFNRGKIKILVTTDLFTRGMDFEDVTHVFNMDLPLDNVDYLHRAGRTGRMDKDGLVVNIVRDREKFVLYKMMKKLNIHVEAIHIIKNKIMAEKKVVRRK
ncbi:MAG: DEAD/DEAH box helicase [Anaeromicrobium sp.]|jgi:superfamily II DNA/RNA helicase|uniref:DEAD/DEAH box helicase n=1 Tax=Anaeromicrobium sp. TaxID=1929132 RepID=UPI0025D5C16B|nr:DEAD/DEAH box helicase [Anaeromicrobium sp.]MCT4595991.1 DEAD/DEAH box helicase [Anaeromicrobium sp.]